MAFYKVAIFNKYFSFRFFHSNIYFELDNNGLFRGEWRRKY